jgi:Family of unknown function (DUF5723)
MTIHRSALTLAAAAAAVVLAAGAAGAQVAATPRSLGMGGAYAALARGQESLFHNPASLALEGTPRWSVAVGQLAAGAGVRGAGFGELRDLADYDALAQPRRDEILAGVPVSGVDADLDLRVPIAAVQVSRLAVGLSWAGSARQNVGRDLVDLVLNGYESGRTDYSVGATGGTRLSFFDLSAAWARRAGPVSVGVAAHYLAGGTLARSRLFEPEFDLEAEDISAEYREVYARGGRGWAVDAGVAAEPAPGVTVSAAVHNLAAGMTWSRELRTRHVVLTRATFDGGGVEAAFRSLEDSDQGVDPSAVPATVYETAQGLYDQAYLPATLHAGVAWAVRGGRTRLAAGYQDALTAGRMGGGWDRTLSVGVEQRVPLVTLRAGAATDLDGGALLSGGMSLGPVHLGVAHTSASAGRSGWIASIGLAMQAPAAPR